MHNCITRYTIETNLHLCCQLGDDEDDDDETGNQLHDVDIYEYLYMLQHQQKYTSYKLHKLTAAQNYHNYFWSPHSRAANPVKPKIGRFCCPKIGRNSKHCHDNRCRHRNSTGYRMQKCRQSRLT